MGRFYELQMKTKTSMDMIRRTHRMDAYSIMTRKMILLDVSMHSKNIR